MHPSLLHICFPQTEPPKKQKSVLQHIALVMDDVIDAIGPGRTQRIAKEIMDIDLLRSLTPTTTLIGEVADQLLVLGIDTRAR